MVKNSPVNAGDAGSIPGLGRFPGEGNGNPLQYSCLGSPITEEPCGLQSTGLKESDRTEQLNNNSTNSRECEENLVGFSEQVMGGPPGGGVLVCHRVGVPALAALRDSQVIFNIIGLRPHFENSCLKDIFRYFCGP